MLRLTLVATVALFCAACSKAPEPPKAPDAPAPTTGAPTTFGAPDVKPMPPPKVSGEPPAPGDRTAAGPKNTMTKEEQSAAMPMPGQANDHSTPAAKPAQTQPR
jgi:hypothetical protein